MVDFGTDVSCFPDLDPAFSLISGVQLIAQAVARRFVTARGGLFYDPNYGYDLKQFLNASIAASQVAVIASQIEAEALKDERVQSASAVVTFNAQGSSLTVRLYLTSSAGPFTLVLTVAQVATTMAILPGQSS